METTMNRKANLLPLFLFLVALIVAFSMAHAVERHGTAAMTVQSCSEGSDHLLQKWQNPDNGRIYWVCDVNGNFGISVEEADGDLVTAFIKDKIRKLEQLERYLSNGGAEQVW